MATTKRNEILLDCYKQFETQCEANNFQFDIKLKQSFQGAIELTTIKDRGRCWIAKSSIKCGQLILIEKAFVYASRTQHSFNALYNSHNKIKHKHSSNDLQFDETAILIAQLIKYKLIKNVNQTENITKYTKLLTYLYPRSNEIEYMEIDTNEFGIESDHDLWLFNHSLSQLETHKNKTAYITDKLLKRIPYIIYYNAMVVTQNTEQLCYFKPIQYTNGVNKSDEINSCSYSDMIGDGIFIKGSFFNHDCVPNTNRYFIGDVMVVKAIRDINIGEECTFSYLESEYLCENETFRANRLPFECNCNLCTQQRSEENIENENECDNETECKNNEEKEVEESDDDIQIFNEIICSTLYSNEAKVRIKMIDDLMKVNDMRYIDMISGYSAKAMTFLELKEYDEASCCWMECFNTIKKSFGDIHEIMIPYYLQMILCKISKLLIGSKDANEENIIKIIFENKEIVILLRKMIQLHYICFGGGVMFFLKRYLWELSFSAYDVTSKSLSLWNCILATLTEYD